MINLLYSRGYTSGSKGIVGFVERVLLSVPKKSYAKFQKLAEKKMTKWNGNNDLKWVCACTLPDCKRYYSANLFDSFVNKNFENRCYFVTKEYRNYLINRYGDYMKFPPVEEQRWTHHPIVVSFDKNYEELGVENE